MPAVAGRPPLPRDPSVTLSARSVGRTGDDGATSSRPPGNTSAPVPGSASSQGKSGTKRLRGQKSPPPATTGASSYRNMMEELLARKAAQGQASGPPPSGATLVDSGSRPGTRPQPVASATRRQLPQASFRRPASTGWSASVKLGQEERTPGGSGPPSRRISMPGVEDGARTRPRAGLERPDQDPLQVKVPPRYPDLAGPALASPRGQARSTASGDPVLTPPTTRGGNSRWDMACGARCTPAGLASSALLSSLVFHAASSATRLSPTPQATCRLTRCLRGLSR